MNDMINVKYPPEGLTALKGDDTTNESPAFASLLKMGTPLYFPRGAYSLDPFILPQNVTLYGECRGNTLLKLRPGQSDNFVTIANDNCGLVDLQINGNYWSQNAGSGVYLSGSHNNVRLERLNLKYCKEHGMHVPLRSWVYNPKDIIADRCMGWGIYNLSSDNRWDDIYANSCHLGGIYEGGANNIWQSIKSISNGIYDGAVQNTGAVGIQVSSSGRSQFVGLDLQENAGHGLYIKKSVRCSFISVVCDSNGCDFANGVFTKPPKTRGDGVYIERSQNISITSLDSENRNTGTKQSQRRAYTIDANSSKVKITLTADYQNNEIAVNLGKNCEII